ncbi:MAG: monovalent cation/H+ antiporter subunit D family protein [Rhodospirillales bacterium]
MNLFGFAPETAMVLAVLTPLAGVLIIAAAGRWPNVRDTAMIVVAAVTFLIVLGLLPVALAGGQPRVTWFEMFPGLGFTFRLEPLGMIFALIASFLWIITSLYAVGYMRGHHEENQTRFYMFFAMAIAAALAVAFSGNMLTLFAAYEVLTISTFPLVAHHGTEESKKAGRVYLGILLCTSIGLMMLAMIITYVLAGTLEFTQGGVLEGKVEGPMTGVLLALYCFGVGKAALMPMHRWLPAAMVAPTPVSALLHAVAVVKAGVFSVVKIIVYIMGYEFTSAQPFTGWLVWIAGFSIIAASVVAMRQDNLKRRLAYSTVSQLSYVTIAAAILAPLSIVGAALHIAMHAFGKITLFFAAGSIMVASGKTEVSQLDGVGRRMPVTMAAFTIGALSMIGLPPTAGFISKWYILQGAFQAEQMIAVIVVIGSTLLNAAYFLPIVYAAWFKPEAPRPQSAGAASHSEIDYDHGEAPWPMVIAIAVTAAGTILLFLNPQTPLALARAAAGL